MQREEMIETLAGLALFADLSRAQLEAAAHTFEEQVFTDGQRVLRQGFQGSAFHVILDGEAVVHIDGAERSRLGRGDFFGEISILLGEAPSADVVAVGPLRCLVLDGPLLEGFLLERPQVTLRMLQAQTRRLRAANRWRS